MVGCTSLIVIGSKEEHRTARKKSMLFTISDWGRLSSTVTRSSHRNSSVREDAEDSILIVSAQQKRPRHEGSYTHGPKRAGGRMSPCFKRQRIPVDWRRPATHSPARSTPVCSD